MFLLSVEYLLIDANMADAHGTENKKDRGDDRVPAHACGVKLPHDRSRIMHMTDTCCVAPIPKG